MIQNSLSTHIFLFLSYYNQPSYSLMFIILHTHTETSEATHYRKAGRTTIATEYTIHSTYIRLLYSNIWSIYIVLLSSSSIYSICKNVSITYSSTQQQQNIYSKIFVFNNINYLINFPFLPSIQSHFPYSFYNSSPPIS